MKKEIIISVLAVLLMTAIVAIARPVRNYNNAIKKMDRICNPVVDVDPDALIAECERNIDSLAVAYGIDESFDDTVGEFDEYQDYIDATVAVHNATNEQSYLVAVRWYLTAYRSVLTCMDQVAELQRKCRERNEE